MSLNHENMLDYLWKARQGFSATSPDKAIHNESITTYDPIFLDNIWAMSGYIPTPAPLQPAQGEGEPWSAILAVHRADTAIQLRRDITSPGGSAWIAVNNPNSSPSAANRLIDFIPTKFHGSYRVRVWAGNPNGIANPAVMLTSIEAGYEWEFDYASGVLYFFNKVPAIAIERGIWIEAWRYVGPKGNGQRQTTNTREMLNLNIATGVLPFRTRPYDVDLVTGSTATLVEVRVNAPAIVECHSTPERVDTNPYRFVAEQQHLIDDGSYTVAGRRVWGPQFVTLVNKYDPDSAVTYWRVWNNFQTPQAVSVAIQLIRHY